MDQSFSLNDMYARYAGGTMSKKEFEGLIVQTIFGNLKSFHLYHWKHEDRDDFISWLYPRISRAIDSYHDKGASFETYFGVMIRLSAKEYRCRMAENKLTEYASWSARFPEQYAFQAEPDYSETPALTAPVLPPEPKRRCRKGDSETSALALNWKKNPRQILILILKCYYYISDDFLDHIALTTGIEAETLKSMVDKLRALRLKRDESLRDMKERIHCQFYRCIVYENKLSFLQENSDAFNRMELRLEKARQRLAAMRKRLAGIRMDATNRQIADVIGISKGTVDASLHKIKNRWIINLN